MDFNPHHHAGGDIPGWDGKSITKIISIHTTTQVVTSMKITESLCSDISIHTTTQVVT